MEQGDNDTMDTTKKENLEWELWSPDVLEWQVSPSRWRSTTERDKDTILKEYLDATEADTIEARHIVPHQLNISYGIGDMQKLDLYGTDLSENSPIVVFIHGGYWQAGSKDTSGGFAVFSHKNQHRFVALGYTIAPAGNIHNMQDEIKVAVDFLSSKYPKAKLILIGHSAGAQLTASLLHNQSLESEFYRNIAGLILMSGVFDLLPIVKTYVNEPLQMTEKEAFELSGLHHDFNGNIHRKILRTKVLVIVGGLESPLFHYQSSGYYSKLQPRIRTQFHTSERDDHFTLVQNMSHESSDCAQSILLFIKSCLA